MGFFEAVGSVLSNYFSFSGRALRSEYWYWNLFYILGAIPVSIMAGMGIEEPYFIYSLAIIIPTLSVTVRRLHDTDHNGWWALIALIPFGFLLLLYWLTKKGDPSKNRFGMPPYGSKSDNSSASRAAREIPSEPPTNSEPNSNPSAERQSDPTPAPSRPQSRERAQSTPRASSSASTPSAKSKDVYFDNIRKPTKSETSESPSKPSTPDTPNENKSPPKSSSDDDVFFDNRLKKE